jgi:hypothetical protein
LLRRPDQFESPSCASVGGELWFPDIEQNAITLAESRLAKAICLTCIHTTECADWAIANELYGIWGGLTDLDRRNIRRAKGIKVIERKSLA